MDMAFPYLAQLGLAGTVFVVLIGLLHLGLTQFFKTTLRRFGATVQGSAVLLLSLAVGALLGAVMLSRAATVLDITLPEPWGGIVAGLVLAATVSGLVSYQEQRAAQKQRGQITPDILAGILAQAQQAAPNVTVQVPPPAAPIPPTTSSTGEALSPITPEDLARTRTDWPPVSGLDTYR
ncbi:hypothetical protein DEIPH_ctg013orf0053 [Deinococcus phoenicis]|uniref:Uncharacterized protein n=2 Tax=Deinococcus phoenicis TaxID=1476583 RepID=A0A016QSA8_9DEIO|nr:hypothetical protein DEIPH_ctg013orf0053 [Deinococcus phoenicis]